MTKQQLEDKNKALRAENEEIRAKLDYVVRELEQCRGRENIGSICEEMADVEIMLEQLKIVFHNRAAVDYHRSQKLQRLSDRLNGNHDSF